MSLRVYTLYVCAGLPGSRDGRADNIRVYAAVCLACAVTSPMTHENCPRPLRPMPEERFHHAGYRSERRDRVSYDGATGTRRLKSDLAMSCPLLPVRSRYEVWRSQGRRYGGICPRA